MTSARISIPASPARSAVCVGKRLLEDAPWLGRLFDVRIADAVGDMVDLVASTGAELVVVPADGPATLSAIRELKERFPRARVALVAEAGDREPPEAQVNAADFVLSRPLDASELRRALGDWLRATPVELLQDAPRAESDAVLVVTAAGDRIREALAGAGLRPSMARTQEEAMARCETKPAPQVVVVDLESPALDPFSLAFELRTRAACQLLALLPEDAAEELIREVGRRYTDLLLGPSTAAELVWRVRRLLESWRDAASAPSQEEGGSQAFLNTRNEAMRRVLESLRQVAPTDATVLLRGETGTGKEVLARLLHRWSARRDGPFFSIDCGALPESLLDSELFGHERGAFTGAVQRKRGRIELAAKGTLFLDEIGELTQATQAKLLRVLQEKEFMRVGGEDVMHCDVRFIAATHRDLEGMIREGTFRSDLYYRLNVVQALVPPLRERPEDLPELAAFLLRRLAQDYKRSSPRLSPEALSQLAQYHWPGNVRELENALERAMLLSIGNEIREIGHPGVTQAPAEFGLEALRQKIDREYLVRLLVRHSGNVTAAAVTAGIGRRTVYRLLKSLQIDPREYRARPQRTG
jgi:DNA-binding NtrC family response regulator